MKDASIQVISLDTGKTFPVFFSVQALMGSEGMTERAYNARLGKSAVSQGVELINNPDGTFEVNNVGLHGPTLHHKCLEIQKDYAPLPNRKQSAQLMEANRKNGKTALPMMKAFWAKQPNPV